MGKPSGRVAEADRILAMILGRYRMMAKRADRWRPYRSVASWYLWRALELK